MHDNVRLDLPNQAVRRLLVLKVVDNKFNSGFKWLQKWPPGPDWRKYSVSSRGNQLAYNVKTEGAGCASKQDPGICSHSNDREGQTGGEIT
jgi:hypothetical protein